MRKKTWPLMAPLLFIATVVAPEALAQETGAAATETLAAVEIKSKKNPGDLPYKGFLSLQNDLFSYLPPEPLAIDVRFRVSFTAMEQAQRDVYLPETWAVSIVGDTVDHPVAVARGGYFLLPDLKEAARERATIMFNSQTRKNWIDVAWLVRLKENNTLPYEDFAKALEQVKQTQANMPWYRPAFRYEKNVRFDGLKACFNSDGGDILVDGQPAETISRGPCKLLKFEPAKANTPGSVVAILGPVANVTLDTIN
jgi:hypothetical protein